MKKITILLMVILSAALLSCRNKITFAEDIDTAADDNLYKDDIKYALEIDKANAQNMEEALRRYADNHNGKYKLIFTGTSTKEYTIWTSITQMLEDTSLKNIEMEISFKYVNFPNNKIPDYILGANAINRTVVKVTLPNTITEIGEYAIYCPALRDIQLPSSLVTIGNRGLIGCANLKNLKLPNSLKSIGQNAIKGCGFSSIEIPDSVTYIGKAAFGDCESFTYIKLPSGLKEIPESMIESSGSLTTITIPASVTRINNSAFYYCIKFESIKFVINDPNKITVGNSVFSGCPLKTIYVPKSSTAYDNDWRNALHVGSAVSVVKY